MLRTAQIANRKPQNDPQIMKLVSNASEKSHNGHKEEVTESDLIQKNVFFMSKFESKPEFRPFPRARAKSLEVDLDL